MNAKVLGVIMSLVLLGSAACARTHTTISPNSNSASTPVVEITDSSNGTTIHTAKGHHFHLVLLGQGWTFSVTPQSDLALVTPTASLAPIDCRGAMQHSDCGSTTVTYLAERSSTVTISASRSMCGEARQCTGTEGTFSVTVVIGRGVTAR